MSGATPPTGSPQPPAQPPAQQARPRRRRAMASALRWLAAREGAPRDAAPLRERLSAIAASQGVFLPAPRASEGDLAEIMARLAPGSTLPPELAPVLAALLQPLFSLRPEPRSPAR